MHYEAESHSAEVRVHNQSETAELALFPHRPLLIVV